MATSRGGTPLPVRTAKRARAAKMADSIPREVGDAESVMGELGGKSARVELYRRDGVEFAYVDTIGGDSVDKEVIKREYGPGKYQARVYEPGSDSDPQLIDFAIAAPPMTTQRNENDPVLRMMAAVLDKLEKMNAEPKQDRALEMVARAMERMAAPREDNKLMETFMVSVLPELIKANRAPAASGGSGDGISMLEVIKMMQEERNAGMQLGERMAERASGDGLTAVAGVIRDVGAPLANAIGDRMKQEAAKRPALPPAAVAATQDRAPGSLAAAGAVPAPSTTQTEMTAVSHAIPAWLAAVVPYESIVINWAKSDADVAKKASWMLDAMDDDAYGQVAVTLALPDDDVLVLVDEAVPGLKPYREWTVKLLGALRAELANANADEGDV